MAPAKPRILLAEDEADLALLARRLLEEAGYDVVTVADADQVLPRIILDRPALVLLDVMMPSDEGLDGFVLCERIKANPHHARLPVVILSAIADGTGRTEESLRRAAGADAYLHKPYDPERLLDTVRTLLPTP